ncbi:glycosyltransferase family 9 protein [Marinomonas sp. M1K-6]|uniref:Glycosyltransferase family 9 protein n=1 Tax=Marinomonas profundi TaxID=2726122 RepID=A0A847QZ04_9GAMM|nr:glycosyltransferase family 9 protein [Marinomonas profundi]NLQ16022.1 glycosyltransferase family 9 protein [Marinomonas profundi]UDV03384.1 glycosyltransferase family 9 protein [Marinomonas profundi]
MQQEPIQQEPTKKHTVQGNHQIQHLAVVRLSALGDVCHAMAVVQAIMISNPSMQVTWVTSPLEANLVRLLKGVRVVEYDKRTGVKGLLALRALLKGQTFDVLLHLQWSLRASLVSRMLSAKRRIGFALSHSREKQHWFVNEYAPEPQGEHVLDSFLSIASVLGVTEPSLPCELSLPERNIALPDRYVVINPSASKAERNWTLEGYQAVLDRVLMKGLCPVMTGGPSKDERAFAEQVIADRTEQVINLVGKTPLDAMLSVLKGAALVISPDTGPAHMATLVGTPVLGLYAHSNPERTGPYRDLANVVSVYEELVVKEHQKPIAQLPWSTRVHDPKAMQHISIERVLAVLDTLI